MSTSIRQSPPPCVAPESTSQLQTKAGLRTQDGEAHLRFARDEGRVIVTRDQDFLRLASGTSDHSGIVFYTANQSIREIIEGLILIYEVMLPSEMARQIEYI